MKKLMAVLLSAMLISSFAVSASAYESPDVHGNTSSTTSRNGGDGDGTGSRTTSTTSARTTSTTSRTTTSTTTNSTTSTGTTSTDGTSPKTGAPVAYGMLMAVAALAFGGVAVSSKKKIED